MPNRPFSIHELLSEQAEVRPEAAALLAPGRKLLTYQALRSQVEQTTAALRAIGVRSEDAVAIVLPNGPEMAAAFLGVAAGAVAAPLNPGYREKEFDFYFSDLNPKALIVEQGAESAAVAVAKSRNVPVIALSPCTEREAGVFTLNPGPSERSELAFSAAHDVALVLHTSGTTSRPKIVPLTHQNLIRSAYNIKATLELSPRDCCLNVMPLFHIHGLIGATLSSMAAGGSIVCTPGFYAPQFFEWLLEFHPTWYTAVPTMHQAILARAGRNQEITKQCPLRLIRSSSSALPPKVMKELEEVFGAPVIESYGMTEAAHQMASNPLPPGERKPGSVGPAAGPEIAIMDENGHLLESGRTGEIVIRGANVTRGYQNNPGVNQSAFTDGWFRTGDEGFLDSDGYLFITGRIKEMINRGGEKISPREVDEALMEHPAVRQAVAFALPDSRLGEDVGAAVVLRENTSATEFELRDFAAQRLADFKVPRRIVFLEEIPKGPTGKLQRIGLASKLGLDDPGSREPKEAAAFTPPRTETEVMLAALWAKVLGVERVGADDNFFALGGDSILATQLIARVRQISSAEISILSLFESPTLAEMAQRLDISERPRSGGGSPPLRRIPRERELPLSPAQARLWFVNQFGEKQAGNIRPAVFRLRGSLDVKAIESSVHTIIQRHEPLRTTFGMGEDGPVQVIGEARPLSVPVIDLRALPESERESKARDLAAEEFKRPFDLSKDLMLRVTLLRTGEQDYWLLLSMHHIASDGWSTGVFLNELSALYNACLDGTTPALPELSIQYADYARWQSEFLQGEVLENQLSYWKRRLQGAPELLPLPADHPRPAQRTFRGARESVLLSPDLAGKLKRLSQQEGATLFMALLSGFQTLLYRLTGNEDIVAGCAVAGRDKVEAEPLIGPFFNLILLRTDFSGEPGFRQLLERVRNSALEAYSHQDLSIEKLVEALQPKRSQSYNPLYQVLFQLRNLPLNRTDLQGLEVEEIDFDPGTAVLDLSLEIAEEPRGLDCRMTYNTDIFEAATIRRMLGQFQTLLEAAVENPDLAISRIPILTAQERRQLLLEWNDTRRDYPRACLQELFEAQVERTPDAPAVVFEDQEMSYRELNRRANCLAHDLRERGVGPEKIVGLCVERSLDLLVGFLGILKAGGAYLPLDRHAPPGRLTWLLEDAQAQLVLTQEHLREESPWQDTEVVSLDGDWTEISQRADGNPPPVTTEHSLAYVMYTSSSTGKPKGVPVEHKSLMNYLCWVNECLFQDLGSSWLPLLTTLTFDACLKQLFAPLLRGAPVWVLPPGIETEPNLLLETLSRREAVALNCVPALWAVLLGEVETGRHEAFQRGLTHLYLGGEDLSPELIQRTQALFSQVRIWNLYGPTEATANATAARLVSKDRVTIGRPVANTQIYVLDRHMNPAPVGVPGELHIGGAGLARGYLNRPELTAERFTSNPFSDNPRSRLYKSGDLACYLPDGNIQFLGRQDRQVKIRGLRIELGEIEARLAAHPDLEANAVTLFSNEAAERQLIAYVVPKNRISVSEPKLRKFLQQSLPEYMLPSRFMFLEKLPLFPNGKVNYRALSAPGKSRPPVEQPYVAPRTAIERTVAETWCRVLGLDSVGIHDDFFDLGGHSLLANRIASMLRHELQIDLELREFFESPTVSGLAEAVAKRWAAQSNEQTVSDILNSVEALSAEEVASLLAKAKSAGSIEFDELS